ncbi:MAG: hypothetical protein KJ592_05140, partial [Nanoarchaeota archaeon]|nr:hypothetical protein [Nanoarchaeota archaeon]
KVKAKKIDGIVYVELAEIPAVVGFKIAREVRKKAGGAVGSRKSGVGGRKSEEKVDDDDKDKDGVSDKLEEKEDARAGAEMGAKIEKADAKIKTHTTDLKHEKRSMPKRKVLK